MRRVRTLSVALDTKVIDALAKHSARYGSRSRLANEAIAHYLASEESDESMKLLARSYKHLRIARGAHE